MYRILLKYNYPVSLKEYGVPKSSLTIYLRKIYLLPQSRNLNDFQNIFEVGGISRYKFREIGKLSVNMNKSGRRTYLNEDKESLVVASAEIEGIHGLPFDCPSVAGQLQNFVKAVKSCCGD